MLVRMVQSLLNDVSFYKALCYRIFKLLILFLVVFLAINKSVAFKVTLLDLFLSTVTYYVFEKIWERII